jgi:peptidoglycan/xylan/chitin deacetylase (PgdA/CDA1 family)
MHSPVISFTFDDVPRSAVFAGGEILGKHGLHGTYYVSMGLANGMSETGEQFCADDLQHLAASEHEIGCHTFGHLSFKAHTPVEIAADLDRNRNALEAVLPGREPRQFSFPFGHVSRDGWRLVSGRFESCRGIAGGINLEPIRFNMLAANRLYESVPLIKNLKLVDEVTEQPGWLIFYTHDVAKPHSPYGCSPEYFEAVVSKAAGCGAEVLKIGEAVQRFKAFAKQQRLGLATPSASPGAP